MSKELLIILIILVLIIVGDYITNCYNLSVINNVSNELEQLKEDLIKGREKPTNERFQRINAEWKDYHKVLACYIEHDELEKVEIQLAALKGKIEVKQYKESIENIDTMIFFLKHIENKEKFTIQSIL